MSVKTRCPNQACSQINAVDPSQVRQRVRCPACGTRYVVQETMIGDPAGANQTQPAPRQSAPTPAADRIGRFVIREKLGAGAFGTVYRAYDPQLDRKVALKVPHASVLDNPRQVERFLREARAAAQLRHPHIVPVFDAGTDGGRPYIATAFIQGRPLSDAIEDGGMEYDRAARLARELAEALAYAHAQGIVHRDVKPANVLLDDQDHANLMDFGLAARRDEEAKLTYDGTVLGTPAYMAPEQVTNSAAAAPSMDQYSLGIVLYEMLTGRVPFRGSPQAVIYHAVHTAPPSIQTVRPAVPAALASIVHRAINKAPAHRYPDCGAFGTDLDGWRLADKTTTDRPPAAETREPGPENRWVAHHTQPAEQTAAPLLGFDDTSAGHEEPPADDQVTPKPDIRPTRLSRGPGHRRLFILITEVVAALSVFAILAYLGWAIASRGRPHSTTGVLEGGAKPPDEPPAGTQPAPPKDSPNPKNETPENPVSAAAGSGTDPVTAEVQLPPDFADRLQPGEFLGHAGDVSAIAVSSSGSRFATVGSDRTVRLWSVTGGKSKVRHSLQGLGVAVAWADGDRQLIAADGFGVMVMDPSAFTSVRPFQNSEETVCAVAATPDGRLAITGLANACIRVWDLAARRSEEHRVASRGAIAAVDVSPDGKRALTADEEELVNLWELPGKQISEWRPHRGGTLAVRFSPDGKLAATAGRDGTAAVYDLNAQREVCRLTGHDGPVTGIAWQSAGRQLVTVGADGTARLWDAETGRPMRWVQKFGMHGTCVAVDPGDRFVLVGTSTGVVELFPLPRVRAERVVAADLPADPLPVPDSEAVAAAMAAVRMELSKEYEYTRADEISMLADKLRCRASAAGVTPAARYGLFQEARRLAMNAGDPATAVRVIGDLAACFDVDELGETTTTLSAMISAQVPVAVASAVLVAAKQAESDARPALATELLDKLSAQSNVPKELVGQIAGLRRRSTALAAERQWLAGEIDVLTKSPEDARANGLIGTFLCLTCQDWAAGLPHLVKGPELRLVDAARFDLKNPTTAKAQVQVGDLWLALATDYFLDEPAKLASRARARLWFERASKGDLNASEFIKNRARLDEIAKLDNPSNDPPPRFTSVEYLRAYNTVGPDAVATEWKLAGGAVVKPNGVALPAGEPALYSRFGLLPSGRLALSLRPDGRNVQVLIAGQQSAFAARGKTLRLVIERKFDKVVLIAADRDTDPVLRTVELPAAARGPTRLSIHLSGTPTETGPAVVTAAIARGRISLLPVVKAGP